MGSVQLSMAPEFRNDHWVSKSSILAKKNVLANSFYFHLETAEASKKLIENGTNAEIKDSVYRTPMHLASENGKIER